MYRIDEFLEYYNTLKDNQVEIVPGKWVNAVPLPFYYGFFSKGYWKERKQRKKDAKAVRQGQAIAVTWNKEI